MSQGESRKEGPGFMSRRRHRGINQNPENGQNGVQVQQPPPYLHNMGQPQRQPLRCWHPPGFQHHNNHHIRGGPMNHYRGHQMFMQHGPFGSDNNQYRPPRYPVQFPVRFPYHPDHPGFPVFSSELRRNGYGYHSDRGHFDDVPQRRYGSNSRERGSKNDLSNGSRQTRFHSGKKKCFKKSKKNQNNSSKVSAVEENRSKKGSLSSGASNCSEEKEPNDNSVNKDYGTESASTLCSETDSFCEAKLCQGTDVEAHSDTEHNDSNKEEAFNGRIAPDKLENLQVESDVLGAVGGGETSVFGGLSHNETNCSVAPFDKNLIDEGAICDLDRMFQHQEFSRYNGDNSGHSDDYESEDDLRPHKDNLTSLSRRGNTVLKDLSDDDSELENCSYVCKSKQTFSRNSGHSLDCVHSSYNQRTKTSSHPNMSRHPGADSLHNGLMNSLGRFNGVPRNLDGDNSDDGEDTGDFIDTDLPSHNKHILSSSDEMDNISVSSISDHEEDNRKVYAENQSRKQTHSDLNSNDLSSFEAKVQNGLESLCVNETHNKVSTPASSQLKKFRDSHGDNVPRLSLSLQREASCSSESENGDSSPLGSPPQLQAPHVNSMPHVWYNTTAPCLDGAAASHPLENHQKHLTSSYNSCPPGAECELPPVTPPQCFHSNVFCSGSRHNSCNKHETSVSPGREHVAFTASSELDHGNRCHHLTQPDPASCSTTADGGACCPGYQMPDVNDLNACCHHSHSHVANGFSSDSPRANFSNDESNRHQKVFVKFPIEDKVNEGESHSASSCELEDIEGNSTSVGKQDKSSDSGGSQDPLSHDSSDNVDMVLLPMEEEIEPVHHMGAGLCAGGVVSGDDNDNICHDSRGQLATPGSFRSGNVMHLCDDYPYLCANDQNPLGNGMPSKEFYELIKTVSTSDSYMRFFDKDGQDVQRQPLVPCDDDTTQQNSALGGQSSKTERLKVDRVMIWNEYEAYVMQFKQIAVSACGQTAVLNVLKALKFTCEKSAVCKVIQTSLRKEDACIPEYLFSRARAGTTAEELMSGVEKLSGGTVGGRFFHFWPPRKVKLLQWLTYWMKRGAIPMATLNLQQGPHSLWQVPDSWHHQMVYGVSHQGLYLTNPLEIVSERSAMKQLCSDSVLMVRRQDIISRFRETTDLGQLLNHPDSRWRTMNVLGQVVNVLREYNMPSVPGYRLQVTSHVSIPASYKAGITLFMRKDKSSWNTLLNAPEIPLENPLESSQ